MAETGLLLLAAGNSSRMGSPKQLLDVGGRPLIRRAAETALASACRPVVVLGSRAEEIRPALHGLALEVVVNPRWEEGVGTSIGAGVLRAQSLGLDGVILMLADQVGVTPATLERLLAARRTAARSIAAARYAGTVGVPVYFDRHFFPQLLALPSDRGCKGIILAHREEVAEVDCPEAEADLDTPQDYARLCAGEASHLR